jgi:radical SAM protein with 4Fe4S-binding SPASM domain
MRFSDIWEGGNPESEHALRQIRSLGLMTLSERKYGMSGPCGRCKWFDVCGGGFRTRAAFAHGGELYGSDPGCYLSDQERGISVSG